jgi:hypothetical protein
MADKIKENKDAKSGEPVQLDKEPKQGEQPQRPPQQPGQQQGGQQRPPQQPGQHQGGQQFEGGQKR